MALEIPKEDTGSIVTLKSLPDASLNRFVAALESAPPISDPEEMASYIAERVPIPKDRLSRILSTLYTLYHIRELSDVRESRFLDDLIEGIRNIPDIDLTPKKENRLRPTFEKLLGIETLAVISKAARLQRDGERLYCTAKILSDVRPVFGRDPTVAPLGAVLAHTLKVGYHEGKEHREFHVVLDSNDLDALEDVIRRARAKDATLRQFLKTAGLRDLDD